MTDRHSTRALHGPSLIRILTVAVLASMAITAMAATFWGARTIDRHSLTGTACAFLLALILLGRTYALMVERERARTRQRRHEAAQEATRRENTASWRADSGEHLTVFWDGRRYLVSGWLGRDWLLEDPTEWADLESLACLITEVEDNGIRAYDDIGTRTVRARLDVPGWEVVPERLTV